MGDENAILTDELLERLLASASPEAYLAQAPTVDTNLAALMTGLLEAKGLKRSQAIEASGVNATFAYETFAGRKHPSRDYVIALAFGLRCDLDEAQHLLIHAGHAQLWCKARRDAIIIHCLANGLTRAQCDDELYRLGEQTLVKAD